MNAYVIAAGRVHVVSGAGWLEVHPEQVVMIRGQDPERRPLAAVRLSDALWVALGDEPPACLEPQVSSAERQAVDVPGIEEGWPPEPPPDVDSQA